MIALNSFDLKSFYHNNKDSTRCSFAVTFSNCTNL